MWLSNLYLLKITNKPNSNGKITNAFYSPIQMITSPLILQQPLDVIQHNGNGVVATVQKENILQGA